MIRRVIRASLSRLWIACFALSILVAAGWIWSYFATAEVVFQMAPRAKGQEAVAYFVSQTRGRIELAVNSPPGVIASWPIQSFGLSFPFGESPVWTRPPWRYGGFDAGVYSYTDPRRVAMIRAVAVPHWFVLGVLIAAGYWSRRRQRSERSRGFEVEPVVPGPVSGSPDTAG